MWWSGVTLLVIAMLGVGGWYLYLWELKQHVIAALGTTGTAERIETGWSTVTLTNVRLRATEDWPEGDTFRAREVVFDFDPDALLHRQLHIQQVNVRGYYLAVRRTPEKKIALLPNLKRPDSDAAAPNSRAKLIDHVVFDDGDVAFFDEAIRKPAYKITVKQVHATVDHLQPPAFTEPFQLDLTGKLPGKGREGTVKFAGWINKSTSDAQSKTVLTNVDIAALDPYLLKKANTLPDLKNGVIDLNLDATVKDKQIKAHGAFTLRNLEPVKEPGLHPIKALLRLPEKAELAALKDDKGQITLNYEVSGNLHQPKFALTDSLPKKMAGGLPKVLGTGVEKAGSAVKKTSDTLLDLITP